MSDTKISLADIFHLIIASGLTAASIFVKNPNSQQHAVNIINLLNQSVIPLADNMLSKVDGATVTPTK